jgi:HD superfamily phosphodiesterase
MNLRRLKSGYTNRLRKIQIIENTEQFTICFALLLDPKNEKSMIKKKSVRVFNSKKVKRKMIMNSMGAGRVAGLFMFVVVVLEQ